MKKVFLYILISLFVLQSRGFCIELDNSIDAQINKTYNASQLEETLPKLPDGIEPNISGTPKLPNSASTAQKPSPAFDKSIAIKIRRGTKFQAVSKNWASDSAKVGNIINFRTTKPVTKRYITIPAGSVLHGRIIEAHAPQYTGNGGLIKIEIQSITIDSANKYTEGKITKANGKKIFFNNIKGKRRYTENLCKNVQKSHKFFQKAMKKTSTYANDGLTVILSPFTFLGGTLGYVGGVVLSPVVALKSKGSKISLPPETIYEIKLNHDLYIYD